MTFPRPGDVDVEGIIVPTLPEDSQLIADKLTAEVALLEQLVATTIGQENPSPSLLRFFGAVGASVSEIVTIVPRWRATGVLITPGGFRRVTLRVGTATTFVFDLSTNGETRYFPFPEMFDGGVDLQWIGNGAFAGDGFWALIIGYPETTP